MKTHLVTYMLAPCALLMLTTSAYATEQDSGLEGGSIRVAEGLTLQPAGMLSLGYDSNVTAIPSNEVDSWFTSFAAGGTLVADVNRASTYAMSAALRGTVFADSSDDNYLDADVVGGGTWRYGPKSELEARAEYTRGHDARGQSGRVSGSEPDTWNQVGVAGTFRYGRPEAKGRVELDAGYHEKFYDDFYLPLMTEDKSTGDLGAAFFYKVGPKTEVLIEARYANIDYDIDGPTKDNDVYRVRTGVVWNATAKTQGIAKVGYTEKDFGDPTAQDPDSIDWRLELRWTPSGRDMVDLFTERRLEDSTGTGDYVKATDYSIAWKHNWMPRLISSLGVTYSEDIYEGAARQDDGTTYNASLEYEQSRRLIFGGMVKQESRDSNINVNDYDRSVIGVYVKTPN